MKISIKKIDLPLLFSSIILIVFGLIMVFSSSSISAVLLYNESEFYFFQKQLLFIIVGLIISMIIVRIDTPKLSVLSKIGIIAIIGIMFALKTYGTVTNSARSWFRLLGFSVQPSEFAKTIIIIYLATWYGSKKKFKSVYDIFLPLIPCVVIFGLVALEPDLGTAIIIAIICMFIFFSLPIKKNKIMSILRVIVVMGVIFLALALHFNQQYLTETQANRFTYKQPCDRYLDDTGYQVCNGYIAINNGKIFGVGLGKSTQKYLYLPASHTDFIFPIIIEELGLVGGGIVLILLMIVLFRVLVIARNAANLRGSIIAFGTFAFIFTHMVINLGGVLALMPLTGVPLPFLSYGGSFMINLIILLTLTQRVAFETREIKYKKEVREVIGG